MQKMCLWSLFLSQRLDIIEFERILKSTAIFFLLSVEQRREALMKKEYRNMHNLMGITAHFIVQTNKACDAWKSLAGHGRKIF